MIVVAAVIAAIIDVVGADAGLSAPSFFYL